jgi:two-component system chemotaxis sensor kinase CheA
MDRENLHARLMEAFLVELQEHVSTLNEKLLALETCISYADAEPVLDALFRTAHSLKGAARAVSLPGFERGCHALEEILSSAKSGHRLLSASLFPTLFSAADAFEDFGRRLQNGEDLSSNQLAKLVLSLEQTFANGTALEEPPSVTGPSGRSEEICSEMAKVIANPGHGAPSAPAPSFLPVSQDTTGALVRVPAEKLDSLLTRSGELLVAKRAQEQRLSELGYLRASAARSVDDWRMLEKPLLRRLVSERCSTDLSLTRRTSKEQLKRKITRFGERLRRLDKELDRIATASAADSRRIDRAAHEIDGEVRRLRMFPFGEACQGLDRVVRDLGTSLGKKVEVRIEGGDIELDRSILQGLKDPLLHLVRNAVDHAIETPDRRIASGKPAVGRVTVSAALRAGQVKVIVEDDGAGLDLDALRARALRESLVEPSDASEAAELIFRPGISTAASVTNVSGRGVGLDVVKTRVESLHGTIDVESRRGSGTVFTLGVPLTLTTIRALLVGAAGQVFAISVTNVRRLAKIDMEDIQTVRGRQILTIAGIHWAVVSLASVLRLESPSNLAYPAKQHAMLVASGERRVALLIDSSLAEQEIVVKPLGSRVVRVVNFAGATILHSGEIALVLNAADLVQTALDGVFQQPVAAAGTVAESKRRRLLLVDDSLTTRTLEQTILESAGFEVRTANDGDVGWQLLNEHGADLIVSDVDMPKMDGFALTRTIRSSDRFRHLPVILVTARATEFDRAQGVEAGADAYLTKSTFDQVELLATVSRLL